MASACPPACLLLCVTSQAWKLAQDQKEDELNKKGKKGKKEEEVAKAKEKEPLQKEEEKKKVKASPLESVVPVAPPVEESPVVQAAVESLDVKTPSNLQHRPPETLQFILSGFRSSV